MKKNAVPVECPLCDNKRIIDKGSLTDVEAKPADEEYSESDFYIKCWKCKTEIGLKKEVNMNNA